MMQSLLQGGAATKQAPTTRQELDALHMWRGELRDQLRALEERRGSLMAQRSVLESTDRSGLATIDERIKATDARIPPLEAQIARADELIANSVGKFVATDATPAAPRASQAPVTFVEVPPAPPPDFVGSAWGRIMMFEAVAFVLLGFVGYRWMLARFERKLMSRGADAGHVAKLQNAVDSIAVEVERISENQRYVTKLLSEKSPESAQK